MQSLTNNANDNVLFSKKNQVMFMLTRCYIMANNVNGNALDKKSN